MSVAYMLKGLIRKTAEVPPPFPPGMAAAGLEHPDSDDMQPAKAAPSDQIGGDLWGVTVTIEYRAASGKTSVRRITLRSIRRTDEGHAAIGAICHERKAIRSFRFDRIIAVIDDDGEIRDPVEFFLNELQVDMSAELAEAAPAPVDQAKPTQRCSDHEVDKPGAALRRELRDEIRLLCSLSRSDGFMHPAEIEVILSFIERAAMGRDLPMSEDDRAALASYIRRQRPDADVVCDCLERLEAEDPAGLHQLMKTMIAVIDADGLQHPAEIAMIMDAQNRLPALR